MPEKGQRFAGAHPVTVPIVDGGPFSAVVAEGQEIGLHIVTPGVRKYMSNVFGVEMENTVRSSACVLLVERVPSLCYHSRELRLPASINLKPVDSVLCVCTPRSTSHVFFIIRALGATQTTKHADGFCHSVAFQAHPHT